MCAMPAFLQSPRPERGSLLIAAMLVSALIAISLGSYIKLATNSMSLANRSFYQNAAVNLAEVGIEEAIFSFNRLAAVPIAAPGDAWTPYGWTVQGDNSAVRSISGFNVGPGITGVVTIYCSRHNPDRHDRPVVVSRATLSFPNSPATSKFIEVTVRKRSLFPKGMLVRDSIDANGGNLFLDSWDSDPDRDPSTPLVPYSTSVRTAYATLATLNPANYKINLGNGAVYGYISTGGGAVSAGPGAILTGDFSSTEFDSNRISSDFQAVFPTIDLPAPSTVNTITANLGAVSLPRIGDTAAADGVYYYNFASGTSVSSNNGTFTITDNVVLLMTAHAGVAAVDLGGSSGSTITPAGTLKVYTNGDVTINGNGGFSNENGKPGSCIFYGTNTGTPGSQSIILTGNGQISASIFAPNANVSMKGGGTVGQVFGAIVANKVRMNGSTEFHYDEALGDLYPGNPYGIEKWRELQSVAERAVYAVKLSF